MSGWWLPCLAPIRTFQSSCQEEPRACTLWQRSQTSPTPTLYRTLTEARFSCLSGSRKESSISRLYREPWNTNHFSLSLHNHKWIEKFQIQYKEFFSRTVVATGYLITLEYFGVVSFVFLCIQDTTIKFRKLTSIYYYHLKSDPIQVCCPSDTIYKERVWFSIMCGIRFLCLFSLLCLNAVSVFPGHDLDTFEDLGQLFCSCSSI